MVAKVSQFLITFGQLFQTRAVATENHRLLFCFEDSQQSTNEACVAVVKKSCSNRSAVLYCTPWIFNSIL